MTIRPLFAIALVVIVSACSTEPPKQLDAVDIAAIAPALRAGPARTVASTPAPKKPKKKPAAKKPKRR